MKLLIYQSIVVLGFVQIVIGIVVAEVCVYRSKVFALRGAQPHKSLVSIEKSILHAARSLGWMLAAVAFMGLCLPIAPAYAGFLWAIHANLAFLALVGIAPTPALICDPLTAAKLVLGKRSRSRP